MVRAKEGQTIKYIGESGAYEGEYEVYLVEVTYINLSDCPGHERGKLLIILLTNDDTPLFITLDRLDPSEWILVEEDSDNDG